MTTARSGRAQGRLVLVVGPSGAGKDTLLAGARDLIGDLPGIHFVRREITRPTGLGGEDFTAVSPEAFHKRRAEGAYALSWEAHGLCYGVPAMLDTLMKQGHVLVLNGSRTIVQDVRERYARVLVVEISASPEILRSRLASRGREDDAEMLERLARTQGTPPFRPDCSINNDGEAGAGIAALLQAILQFAA